MRLTLELAVQLPGVPGPGVIVSLSITIRLRKCKVSLTASISTSVPGTYKRHGATPSSLCRGLSLNPCCHDRYVFQEETGEGGTPHLQGYIHFNQPVALSTIKAWNPRLHLEQTRSVVQSVAYCSDPTKRTGNIWTRGYTIPTPQRTYVLEEASLFQWQRELLEELRRPPANDRHILWYCDLDGGSGKTAMARFLLATFGAQALYLSGGSSRDILHQVVRAKEDPTIVIFNLARSQEGRLAYNALETIKDGLVQSGKYEGGLKMFAPPHVIVFANWLPDIAALSQDRWLIRELRNNRVA